MFKAVGKKLFLGAAAALRVGLAAWALCLHVGAPAASQAPEAASPAPATCPALLNHSFLRLQDEKPQNLCQYRGQVILVVNTASYCGFTPQYKGLEAIYSKYKERGLVVLGFPSNDFAQETGSSQQIADFCESTFGVKFPMFTKTAVTGEAAAPLFKQLASDSGQKPRWNFYKYLICRDGKFVESFSSMTGPESRSITLAIEKSLAVKAP
jgi:glutathione peroxidase